MGHDVVACFRGVQLTDQQKDAIDEDAVEEQVDQGEMLLDVLKEQQDLFQGLLPLIQVAQQQEAMQQVTTAILQAEAMIKTNQEQQRELRGETFSLSSGSGSSSSSSSLEKTNGAARTAKSAVLSSSSSSTMVMERRGASVVQGTTPNTAPDAAVPHIVPQHYGPWRFAETAVAGQRRQRVGTAMALTSMKSLDSVEYNEDDYGPRLEEALFGQLTTQDGNGDHGGEELQGDSFGKYWESMDNHGVGGRTLLAPKWSGMDAATTIRAYLPKIALAGRTNKLELQSGVYYLKLQYVNTAGTSQLHLHHSGIEAALIIGEIAFDCRGYAVAPGIDWNKLLHPTTTSPTPEEPPEEVTVTVATPEDKDEALTSTKTDGAAADDDAAAAATTNPGNGNATKTTVPFRRVSKSFEKASSVLFGPNKKKKTKQRVSTDTTKSPTPAIIHEEPTPQSKRRSSKAKRDLQWSSTKISEPWQDGDVITFKIDTETNSLGYTVQGPDDPTVRCGWNFKNVLACTNKRMSAYHDSVQLFAYCGGKKMSSSSSSFDQVKFKIVA